MRLRDSLARLRYRQSVERVLRDVRSLRWFDTIEGQIKQRPKPSVGDEKLQSSCRTLRRRAGESSSILQ